MENIPNDADAAAKKEKTMRTMRMLWLIIIPIFAFIAALNLYRWSQGTGALREIFSPTGMIFVGLANIFTGRNKTLSTVFVALGVILVAAGLITLFVY